MKPYAACLFAATLVGCSTPGSLRERTANLTVETQKTTIAFAECFMDRYQNKQIRPTFTIRSNGGTVEFNYQTAVANNAIAVLDISDLGDRRRVGLFSRGDGPVRDLDTNINACL